MTASNAWQRAEWGYTQRAFPLGYIPQGARAAALREIAESRLLGRPGASNTTSVEAATAAGRGNSALAKWRNLGPAPIVSSGTRSSGRVADIAVDPTNSRRWLIGAAQGGIWETLDDGSTWKPLTDDQASMSMGAIAFSPSEPTTIYAGTGEATFSGVSYGGAGVLKSTDGGATWELVGDRDLDGFAFSDLAVDPATSLTIVGATARGTHVLNSYQKPTGIYRSTDGGARWTRMLAGQATDLEVDPSDFNRQVAGIGEIFGDEANGLYRSVDAGVSWTRVAGPWDGGNIGRVELALAPSDSEVLYVSVEDSSDSELLGLWKTRDAFATSPTWETIRVPSVFGRGSYCSPQCWYDHEIIVDPASSDRLFAGGLSLWRMGPSGWASVTPDHVDQHSMAWADGRLIIGNDGGVFSTLSRGEHWTNHNRNLVLTQFYHGAMHPKRLSTMLAGSQDNGTQLRDGKGDAIVNRNDKWTEVFGGDGADMEFSSDSPETAWALSFQRLGIVRTLNGGSSFILATRGIDRSTAPFIGVFAKCPQDEDVFITGTGQLYRTNTFFRGRSPLWRPQGPLLASGDTVTAVAFSTSGIGLQHLRLRYATRPHPDHDERRPPLPRRRSCQHRAGSYRHGRGFRSVRQKPTVRVAFRFQSRHAWAAGTCLHDNGRGAARGDMDRHRSARESALQLARRAPGNRPALGRLGYRRMGTAGRRRQQSLGAPRTARRAAQRGRVRSAGER